MDSTSSQPTMEGSNLTPTLTSSPTPTSTSSPKRRSSVKGKTNRSWGHCKTIEGGGIQCLCCLVIYKGGELTDSSITSGIRRDVASCKNVPPKVRHQMIEHIGVFKGKNTKRKIVREEDSEDEIKALLNSQPPRGSSKTLKGNEKSTTTSSIDKIFPPRTILRAQPTLKSVLRSKEARERCDLAISRWMIDASIQFNVVNSEFYQPMIDAIASMGTGYKGPSYQSLHGHLLAKSVDEVKKFIDSYHTTWKETGYTIMADGWTDKKRRTLINFLVYCPRGVVFLKSVDTSHASKTTDLLHKLLRDVVLHVGKVSIVHFITNNAANYMAAGKKLQAEFPSLYWSICAAHCINLMLQDIGKLLDVAQTVEHTAKLTKFIYSHGFALHLMREHTGGKEILHPAPTRFATNFVALQSILIQKHALRAIVTCKEWDTSPFSCDRKASYFSNDVLDPRFWKDCNDIVYYTEPLVRALRIVDSEDRPAMGYLYAAFHRARYNMMTRLKARKKKVDDSL